VVIPATPYDAKGMLKTALRDLDPVLFFEHRALYNSTGAVPEEEYTVPFGQAAIHRQGEHVTLVATARMVLMALEAADNLAREGISVEVVDPRTLVPFDKETIFDSVRKTNRLVVLDEAYSPCGLGSEIAALTADEAFYYLDAPIKRIHSRSVPDPSSPPLEEAMLPNLDQVIVAIKEVMNEFA
jgi:pyruvate/2-oxoglutarate/acetoin dehydrogenase E1 component